MKTSDKLYEVNANISLKFIALKQEPTLKDMEQLNCILGQIIKEIRILEDENGRLWRAVKDEKWWSEEEVDKIIENCLEVNSVIEKFQRTGEIPCPKCRKPFKKIDDYNYKPDCDCIKKDIRMSVG
jgi:hypothetical protein